MTGDLVEQLRVQHLIAGLRRGTYSMAHHAIYAARGDAYAPTDGTDGACVGCGIRGYSLQWAYDHNDPNARRLWHASHKSYSLCGAPEFYSPRCPDCHAAWDRSHP
jgi:hypothetical protein